VSLLVTMLLGSLACARCHSWAVTLTFVLIGMTGCGPAPTARVGAIVELDDVGVLATFGDREDDPLAVLRRPLDAAFLGADVAIVDVSPPWVRVFDRQGRFLRAMVRRGDGPGEARFPRTLAAAESEQLLLAHTRGVVRLGSDGTPAFAVAAGGEFGIRGAMEACDGNVFVLARRLAEFAEAPGLLLRARPDGTLGDTVRMLGPLRRGDSRRLRASYLQRTDSGVLLHTEEHDRHRLLEMACDGALVREVEVDSLGPPEQTVPGYRPGTIGVRGERPPYPGGVVKLGDTILWATLVVDTAAGGVLDSVTVVTGFDVLGPPRSVAIRGWLQLFASDRAGLLLLGAADELRPKVVLVDGNVLLRHMAVRQAVPAGD
jgi:hypothetical protein